MPYFFNYFFKKKKRKRKENKIKTEFPLRVNSKFNNTVKMK